MVVCVDCPGFTVPLVGEAAMLNVGVTAVTVTVTAVDVDPA